MKDIEFARYLLKQMDQETMRQALKIAATKGYQVTGFSKDISIAPPRSISASFEIKKKKKPFQYEIFLESLASINANLEVVNLAKKWMDDEENREVFYEKIQETESQKNEENKIREANEEEWKEIIEESKKEEKKEEKKDKSEKLQSMVNELRLKLEKAEKERDKLSKEKKKLEKINQEKEDEIEKRKQEYTELEKQLQEMEKILKEKEVERLEYKKLFDRFPKVLLFSKKEVGIKNFTKYNVKQIQEWDDALLEMGVDEGYKMVWVIESDYTYVEMQKIKSLAREKSMEIIVKQNMTKLIERMDGRR